MASLFDRAHQLASRHYNWSKQPPGFESAGRSVLARMSQVDGRGAARLAGAPSQHAVER